MDLEYALITSSSLPDQVRESQYYATLNKEQFLDLVDYSEVLVGEDKTQSVLLLMVAKGTAEQAKEDGRIKAETKAAADATAKALARAQATTKSREEQEALSFAAEKASKDEEAARKKALRERSRSIINGLYNR